MILKVSGDDRWCLDEVIIQGERGLCNLMDRCQGVAGGGSDGHVKMGNESRNPMVVDLSGCGKNWRSWVQYSEIL
jgi:hypothetical protein